MGRTITLKRYVSPTRPILSRLPKSLRRRRPRAFAEWKALREWLKLPDWEVEPIGYVMRYRREKARLTQMELAQRLGCSQQAIAQAERWESNPTVGFLRRWAEACGSRAVIRLDSPN